MEMRSIVKVMLFDAGTIAAGIALRDIFPKLIPQISRFAHNGEHGKLLPAVVLVGTCLLGVVYLWVLGVTL